MNKTASSAGDLRYLPVLIAALVCMLLASRIGEASSHGAKAQPDESHDEAAGESDIRGVDLGEYQVRSYYPVEAQKSTIHFVVHALVRGDCLAAPRQFVAEHQHKVRDQIITATRLAPLALYDEVELTTFRRRILLRLRRALPELAIDDVYISDFSLIVKSL